MGSLGEKKPYSLPRDASESTRLNTQHEVYVSAAGYVLHPRIASSLKGDVRVAEVATGTGIWLKELASTSPSNWSFTGLDISPAQFPQSKDIPKNTTFEVLNILEPVPAKHRGQYDVLHMRLLVCGLTCDDWTIAASNALRLLKPGGWLQWHEGDFADLEALQSVPGARTAATQRLLTDAVHGHRAYGKLRKDDVSNLIGTVKGAGFEDCEDDRCSSDRLPSMRPLATAVDQLAARALCDHIAQNDPGNSFGLTPEGIEATFKASTQEIEGDKIYIRWSMRIVTAKKPL